MHQTGRTARNECPISAVCALQHNSEGLHMIGPAEIYDLMLDHAEKFAVNIEPDLAQRLRWPLAAWQSAFQRIATVQAKAKAFAVRERAGRLFIIDVRTAQDVYSPPDFLQPSRTELAALLVSLNAGMLLIDAVTTFEDEVTLAHGKTHYLALAA